MQPETNAAANDPRFAWPEESFSWTWAEIVDCALTGRLLSGEAPLSDIYADIELHPKVVGKKHWKAKVRQVLQNSTEYVRVDKGVWALRDLYRKQELKKFDELRRKQHQREVRQKNS